MLKKFAMGMLACAGLLAGNLCAQQTADAKNPNDAAVAAASAPTRAGTDPLPSVQEIVAKSVQALGGREAWMRSTSRRTKGFIQSEDSSAFVGIEILQKLPAKSMTKVKLPNGLMLLEVCDGKSVWLEDPRGGYHEVTGAALAYRLGQADLLSNIKAFDQAATGKLLGIQKMGTHTTYAVEFTDKKEVARLYFDTESGLVVHTEDTFATPDGPYAVKLDLDDYRDIEGLKFAFRIKRTEKGAVTSMRLTQVEINPAIEDAIFLKPESAKKQ